MELDLETIRELLAAFDRTDVSELTLKSQAFELTLRKADGSRGGAIATAPPPAAPLETTIASSGALDRPTPKPPPAAPAEPLRDRDWVGVSSPIVGTFYRSPAPGESPFVKVGDRVQVGQTLCIIEAMKTMNAIDAEVAGEIMEILVADGEPIEYNHLLIRIKPD